MKLQIPKLEIRELRAESMIDAREEKDACLVRGLSLHLHSSFLDPAQFLTIKLSVFVSIFVTVGRLSNSSDGPGGTNMALKVCNLMLKSVTEPAVLSIL